MDTLTTQAERERQRMLRVLRRLQASLGFEIQHLENGGEPAADVTHRLLTATAAELVGGGDHG